MTLLACFFFLSLSIFEAEKKVWPVDVLWVKGHSMTDKSLKN